MTTTTKKEVVTYTRILDIPEEKIAEYKEAFDMFDKSHKGTISASDITKIMKNFGYPISRKEVEGMIAEIDTSGDGELDFEEFVTLMQKQTQYIDESDEDMVLRAFKSFDKDHDGKITNYEFRYILSQLGDMFTEEECDTLFKECDLDNDGILVYQDFINFQIGYMFRNCEKITCLDLSNLKTGMTNYMSSVFQVCKSLEYLIILCI